MKKNNSFNKSQPEEDLYQELLKHFTIEDIKRQYDQDPRYPFRCDFYIKPLDLFIEYQGAQEHGPHPFNSNDKEDLNLVNKWKEKALKGKPNSRYWHMIKYWIEIDPLKLKYLRDNDLNFILIYPEHNLLITE